MDWQHLVCADRHGISAAHPGVHIESPDFISELQRDMDRVVFSSAFRRLQGKTQMLVFPETDFVRTRLTHTIEVASIGRVLSHLIFHLMLRAADQDPSSADVQRCYTCRRRHINLLQRLSNEAPQKRALARSGHSGQKNIATSVGVDEEARFL